MTEERTEQVSTYVTPETKDQLKNEARQEGVTLSKYVRQLLERARLEDTQEQLARDLNAEERLLALIAEGKDEMVEIADQVKRQNAEIVATLDDLETEPATDHGAADRQDVDGTDDENEPIGEDENDADAEVDEETRSFVEGLL